LVDGFQTRSGETLLLIGYNLLGLALLVNIVTIAVRAMPSPAFDPASGVPNTALAYVPYIWLPAVVVPIVLFSHLASLWKLIASKS
jgi:branched-subunit amino acid transport protein